MEPNKEMSNTMSSAAGVESASSSVEQSENIMTQGVPEMNKGASEKKSDDKGKMSKKQIIGLVVLSLIALGGVLFGVYGMNSQNEQIAQLKVQMKKTEDELARWTLMDNNEELGVNETFKNGYKSENENVSDDEDDNTLDVSSDDEDTPVGSYIDYIYVDGWGKKIKTPEDLMVVGYKYQNDAGKDISSLCMMGYARKDSQISPSFVKNGEYLVCIERLPKGFYSSYRIPTFSDENYDYQIESAQTYYSNRDDDIGWEKESRELMWQVFGNPDNYSKI